MRLTSALLAMLIAGGVYVWLADGPSAESATAERGDAPQPAVDAAPVRVLALKSAARPLANTVTLRGATEAFRNVEVKAQTGGLVASQPLRKGAHVKKGDALCRLEPGERPAELAEAMAKLRQMEAEARASETLSKRGFSAETAVAADAAALEAAKAAVQRIEIDIARTTIAAPFDGMLETDAAEYGALLQAGSVCAVVISLQPIRFVGYAPERVVDKLSPGAMATARLLDGRRIEAELTFVARSSDPETRTFRVEATAPNADGTVRDGLTAEIEIPLADDRAHLAPHSALTLDDDGRIGVRLVVDGRARFAPVEILRDDAEGVWLAGLPDTAEIIIVGQEYVADGAPVTVSHREAAR